MRAWTLVFAAGFAAAACGGSTTQIAIGPPPPATTNGLLSGPLCADDHCSCREETAPDDGGAGVPADAGHKRFELRLKSPQPLWATVGQGSTATRLYKNAERAEACFYVDLPAGATPIELRGHDPAGVSAEWTIRELGTKTKSYYETFSFNCGLPGVCSFDDLDAIKRDYAGMNKHVRDACGSTQIKGLTWDTGHSPDQLHPSELLVRGSLDVRAFAPWKPHGDPSCGHGRKSDYQDSGGSDAPEDNRVKSSGDDAPPP